MSGVCTGGPVLPAQEQEEEAAGAVRRGRSSHMAFEWVDAPLVQAVKNGDWVSTGLYVVLPAVTEAASAGQLTQRGAVDASAGAV